MIRHAERQTVGTGSRSTKLQQAYDLRTSRANVLKDEHAALTQQVLQAQSSLLQAQNDLYTIWVNYLTARMSLFLDLFILLDTVRIVLRGGMKGDAKDRLPRYEAIWFFRVFGNEAPPAPRPPAA